MLNVEKVMNIDKNTLADKIIGYHQQLSCDIVLPEGFAVLDPFHEIPETELIMRQFYGKFYNDNQPRRIS